MCTSPGLPNDILCNPLGYTDGYSVCVLGMERIRMLQRVNPNEKLNAEIKNRHLDDVGAEEKVTQAKDELTDLLSS